MIRLSWRQFRAPAAVVFGALAVIAVVLAITGPNLVHLYDTTVANCKARGDCQTATAAFLHTDHFLKQLLGPTVLVAPALVGIFWGAPLVARELESNTFRLVWTQSVSRRRWLAVKLALVGLASMVAAGLLSLMVSWWSSPLDRVTMSPFSPSQFDRRDLVPIGYAAFACVLGVTAGVLIRRTLPAMAATLVAFIAVRVTFVAWVRPRLMAPLTLTSALQVQQGLGPSSLGTGAINPADWVVSDNTINAAGRVIGQNGGIGSNGVIGFGARVHGSFGRVVLQGVGLCPNKVPASQLGAGRAGPSPAFSRAVQICFDEFHLREVLTYQPINRYWAFQAYETAIFVGLALVLAGFCFWWVRHRLA